MEYLIFYPLIRFVITYFVILLLLKFVFKISNLNYWTLAGIFIVGSFLMGFFDKPVWLGIVIYIILAGVAFYKKFKLTASQVAVTLIVILAIAFLSTYIPYGKISKTNNQPSVSSNQVNSISLYTSDRDLFKVLFPGQPKIDEYKKTDDMGKSFTVRIYSTQKSFSSYTIIVKEYALQDLNSNATVFDTYSALRKDLPTYTAPLFTSIQDTTFKIWPAIKYLNDVNESMFKTQGIEFIDRNKFYSLVYTNKRTDWNQTDADKFFNSFELIK